MGFFLPPVILLNYLLWQYVLGFLDPEDTVWTFCVWNDRRSLQIGGKAEQTFVFNFILFYLSAAAPSSALLVFVATHLWTGRTTGMKRCRPGGGGGERRARKWTRPSSAASVFSGCLRGRRYGRGGGRPGGYPPSAVRRGGVPRRLHRERKDGGESIHKSKLNELILFTEMTSHHIKIQSFNQFYSIKPLKQTLCNSRKLSCNDWHGSAGWHNSASPLHLGGKEVYFLLLVQERRNKNNAVNIL